MEPGLDREGAGAVPATGAPPPRPPGAEPVVIEGYRDLTLLGRGATSVVYRGLEVEFGRHVAIKVLNSRDPNDAAFQRFTREKEVIGRLGEAHPNIVRVYAASLTADGRPYVSMQLYDGSVQDRLNTRGSFAVAEAVSIMAAIADATQVAHEAGVLHCDIKPQNVLLSATGPALADFGIAQGMTTLGQSLTMDQLTPWHAPPEAFDDAAALTWRSDIWSLGSTLYTMLAGRPPFARSSTEPVASYRSRLAREAVPYIARTDVPDLLREVIERALAKEPAHRFASAAAFRSALLGPGHAPAPPARVSPGGAVEPNGGSDPPVAVPGWPAPAAVATVGGGETVLRPRAQPPPAPLGGPPPAAPRPRRRRTALLALAAVVTLTLGGLGVLALTDDDEPVAVPASPPALEIDVNLSAIMAPTDFVVDDHGDSVDLHWTDRSDGELTYLLVVFRDRIAGTPEQTLPVELGSTDIPVHGLDPDAPYCFRILGIGTRSDGERFATAVDQQVRGCDAEFPPADAAEGPGGTTGTTPGDGAQGGGGH